MYCLHHSATALAIIVAGVIASTCAQATGRVGGAVNVVRDVSGSQSGQSWAKKVQGDDVYENEFIHTEADSSARIEFIDETDIRIGPTATMKIDRVVFKNNRAVSELIVAAEAGAMRWNSGVSLSSAYQVKTPTAIIKVHGTVFDLFVESQQTTVVLRRGTIEVCSIDAPQRCLTLSRPGDMVIATPNALEKPQRAGPGPSEFADRCLSANTMARCDIMASVQPTRLGGMTSPATGSARLPTTGSVSSPTTGNVRSPTTGNLRSPTTGNATSPTRSVEPRYVPIGERTGSQVIPSRPCYHYRGRLKCQSMPSSPRHAGDSASDSSRRASDSSRRASESKLTYVKPSSPKQTYVKSTVRQTYVKPRRTYVKPVPQSPTPIK